MSGESDELDDQSFNRWNVHAANLVCRQLGYSSRGLYTCTRCTEYEQCVIAHTKALSVNTSAQQGELKVISMK